MKCTVRRSSNQRNRGLVLTRKFCFSLLVIPTQAGIQEWLLMKFWIPAPRSPLSRGQGSREGRLKKLPKQNFKSWNVSLREGEKNG